MSLSISAHSLSGLDTGAARKLEWFRNGEPGDEGLGGFIRFLRSGVQERPCLLTLAGWRLARPG